MTMWTAATALLSHWRQRPLQLGALLSGLALATALWSGVQAINAEARASYARAAAVLDQNGLANLVSPNGLAIPESAFVRLRRAGWNVSPVLEGEYRFGATRLRVIGIEPLTMPAETNSVDLENAGELFSFITPPGMLVVSPKTAEKIRGQTGLALRVSDRMLDGAAFIDIGLAQRLLRRDGELSRIVIAEEQRPGLEPLGRLVPALSVREPNAQTEVKHLTESFHLNLTAFGFLAFAVGLLIVYSTIGLAFEQRRPTFRTLRCLGVSLSRLAVLLLAELVFFAVAAGAVGIAIGYLVASLLLPGVAATLEGLYGASVPGTLSLRPEWWVSGFAIALAGTLVSSTQSLLRLMRVPLLAAAQPRAWGRSSEKGRRFQVLAAAALLALSGALLLWVDGLQAGFGVLGCLLLGAALLLPAVLSGFLTLMQRTSSRALVTWFWADAWQQLPGLSLALMALLLALAANVGVGTMVSSFRLTFVGWLDQRLAAELYVAARDESEADRLRAWLATRVESVLPISSVDAEIRGQPVQIFGVVDDPTYRKHWPLFVGTPDVWDRVASGDGILVNEQFWRRERLRIGDELDLASDWKAAVVGVYSDYGNPKGQVIAGIDALTFRYPQVSRLRYGLRVQPDQVADLRSSLSDEFGLPPENIVDQAALKEQSRRIFDRTFLVTGALNIFTLGVAGLAMFSSLLTLSEMRLPQLAPVWATGVTRRDLALLELLRTLVLWLATFIAALPLGLALAWVLLAVVNVEAFGWRLPMYIFPFEWGRLGLVALAAAVVSVFIPLRRLAGIAPSELLKVFANER
ncbi:FtsX-like permease family protein [Sinorhizobium sp. 8-89]|uniref:FtsX-like permease family protein n=1 Tax=Sinorhizobium sp. 7-81 TaxID=3049087 RepID=UPI0024C25DDE|nr:FtsX-like permease family protein [Sinorhizobium sp. 7-81]MDK1389685.1 FtsX-like permease family protein [Sinorhizobium sp. 7-81]